MRCAVQPSRSNTGRTVPTGRGCKLLPVLLIKPGRTFDELLDGLFGDRQPIAAEVEAKEVETLLDPADEGLVGCFSSLNAPSTSLTALTAWRSFQRVGLLGSNYVGSWHKPDLQRLPG